MWHRNVWRTSSRILVAATTLAALCVTSQAHAACDIKLVFRGSGPMTADAGTPFTLRAHARNMGSTVCPRRNITLRFRSGTSGPWSANSGYRRWLETLDPGAVQQFAWTMNRPRAGVMSYHTGGSWQDDSNNMNNNPERTVQFVDPAAQRVRP